MQQVQMQEVQMWDRIHPAAKWTGGVVVFLGLLVLWNWWPQHQVAGLRRQMQQASRLTSSPAAKAALPAAPTALDVFNAEDRARQTLATSIGGLLLLLSALLTLRNVRAAEKSAEVARRNVEIAQDKQITDRFTAAVTNLSADGPDRMAVRLGGIYALERIARDSPNDHWTVMEVLTAYIRDKRLRADPEGPQPIESIPTDIQAILTVIGRRSSNQDGKNRLDIRKVALGRASLRKANFRGANLWGTHLWNTNLSEINLDLAILSQANLYEANMEQASLKQASLRGTKLKGVYLSKADLSGANLQGASLRKAKLLRANLRGAELWGTDLEGADLSGADLGQTKMWSAVNLTQEQLNTADQNHAPALLPPGLTFPGYVPPDTAPAAPQYALPPSDLPAPSS